MDCTKSYLKFLAFISLTVDFGQTQSDVIVTSLTFDSNGVFPKHSATADVEFSVTFKNNGPNATTNLALGGANENFHPKFQQSNINFGGTSGSKDPLSLTEKDYTGGATPIQLYNPAERYNSLAVGSSLTITGKVTFGLDATKCKDVVYLCINIAPKGTAYTESAVDNNWFCTNIFNQISCTPNLKVEGFTGYPDTASPMVGPLGVSVQAFTVTIKNEGSASEFHNDIRAATGTNDVNFAISGYYGKTNGAKKPTDPNVLTGYSFTLNLAAADLKSSIEAAKSKVFSGTISYPALKTADCKAALFICIYVSPDNRANGGTFVDLDPDNNYKCLPMTLSCFPDPAPHNLKTTTNILMDTLTQVAFTMNIKNSRTTPTDVDVIYTALAPNYNFEVRQQLTDVDLNAAGTVDTLSLGTIGTTITDADRRTGLGKTDNKAITGKVWVNLEAAKCSSVKYLCALLLPGTGAKYVDASAAAVSADMKPNTTCFDIKDVLGCRPDPSISAWAVTAPASVVYVQDRWQDLTVTLEVSNVAQQKLSNIVAGTWNFKVYVKFTNIDLTSGISTVNSTDQAYTPATPANLNAKLDVGAKIALGGKVHAGIEKANCNDLKFFCAILYHNNALYGDTDTSNNVKCIDISASKVCEPDVAITTFQPKPVNQTIKDSTASAYTFDITWTNVAPVHSGNNILAPPAGSFNFDLKMTFSDVVMGLGQSDALAIANTTVRRYKNTLNAQASVTKTSVSANLVIPQAKCGNVKYLCVFIVEGKNAYYLDADVSNNVKCISLVGAASKKNCRPLFTNLDATYDLPENSATGLSIFTVKASQPDTTVPGALTFAITSPAAGPGRPFQIGTNSGVVKTSFTGTSPFNAEPGPTQYDLNITVTDGTTGDTAYVVKAKLIVKIIDVNENPTFLPIAPGTTPTTTIAAIPENTATAVFTMTIADPDRPPQSMTYSIEVNPTVMPPAPFYIQGSGTLGTISLSAPGMNFEATSPASYSLTVHVTDGGTAPLTATPLGLVVVPCSDVQEIPTIHNLPTTISLSEAVANNYNTPIFTINATDPDADPVSLEYFISPEPYDGKFLLENTEPNVTKYKANPDFNYDTVREYKIKVVVRDGFTAPQFGFLTVKITNSSYGDLPIIDTATWPASVKIPEDQMALEYLYDVKASDPDGRPLIYKLDQSPYTNPRKFSIDKAGRVYSVANPKLDFETQPTYTLTITACAYHLLSNCTSKTLNVNVVDRNDPPVCTPGSLEVSTPEGSYAPGALFSAKDQDPVDSNLTYSKDATTVNSGLFSINAAGVISAVGLNYETVYSPVHGLFTATDTKGAKCTFVLKVNILDTNARPSFTSIPYTGKIKEDDPTGTSILTVTATDADIGVNGVLTFKVDPRDANRAYDNFILKKVAGSKTAVLRVQSPKDREGMTTDTITFNVIVTDGGGSINTAPVTVTVEDVNDNRPTFTKDLYNFEMMYNDTKGHVLGSVTCRDVDVDYNTPSYRWLDDQRKDNFSVNSSIGSVTSTISPLLANHEYVLFAVCVDNGPLLQRTSLTSVIRVDTYYGWEVLTDWTTSQPKSYYDDPTKVDDFLAGASGLCKPCVPRLNEKYTNSGGKEVLRIYFLKDASTDSLGNIGKKKEFISATDIIRAYTKNDKGTPSYAVSTSKALNAHEVTSIVRYKAPPDDSSWMLDTVGGHVILGLFMSLALVMGLTATVCITRKACGYASVRRPQYDYTPRRISKVTPQREPTLISVSDVKLPPSTPLPVVDQHPAPLPVVQLAPTTSKKNTTIHSHGDPVPKRDIDPPNDFFKETNRKIMNMKGIAEYNRNNNMDW